MRLGEHAAVADHDDIRDPEALPDQRDRGGQRLLVLGAALVHGDRDGAPLGRAGQPVGDLRLAPHPVAGVAERGQGAAAPLDVAGGEVVEHEPLPAQMAFRERLLDPLLARQQPVQRGQQLGLLDHTQIELIGERRLRETAGRRQLRPRPEQPLHHHADDEVALPAASTADQALQAEVAQHPQDRGHVPVRQRTLDLERLVEIDQLAARQHRPDRVDHRLGQMREVAEVLVAHLAALPQGTAQQLRGVDPAALPLRLDCGYVN